jgi:protein-S-isoprenylcysteine O-methyltransferase Ste14
MPAPRRLIFPQPLSTADSPFDAHPFDLDWSKTFGVKVFTRAVLAFLVLPGTFAFGVPLLLARLDGGSRSFARVGLIPLIAGTCMLLWCVRDFYVAGRGTLAPWAPPRHLVAVGLYRFSRNPMYVSVLLVLLGWALGFGSPLLLIYAVVVAVAFHLRVVFGEEPWLARTHGEQWQLYKARVPRWLF